MGKSDVTHCGKVHAVSALFEPRGTIFQNGFLGWIQFTFVQLLPTFDLKVGF